MNARPPLPPGEDDFDAALRERRRLLPRLDDALHGEEPPPELDRLVLDRARDALRRETPPERHYRSPRWAAPVAIAATVLLSFALVTQMAGRGGKGDATLYESEREATAGNPDASLVEGNDTAAAERKNAALDQAGPAEIAAPPAPKPAPTSMSTPASAPASASASASAPARSYSAAPAAPPASPTIAAAAPAPSVAPQATRSAGRAEPFATDLPPARGEQELATMADVATSAQPPPAAPPATPPDARRAPAYESARTAAKAASGRATADAAPATETAADSNQTPTIPRPDPHADPQRWLAEIERLRSAGDLEAALHELAAFRQRHPDRALPPSLDALK
jgi:hypothetical protein